MKFNIDDYKNYPSASVCMNCRTEDEAEIFLEYLHSCGKRWAGGGSYRDKKYYGSYGDETCYFFLDGTFGSLSWAKDENCAILYFSDFDWDDSVDLKIAYDDLFV